MENEPYEKWNHKTINTKCVYIIFAINLGVKFTNLILGIKI